MLGRTNTGGGGGGLNFKVICGTQPSTAKENTIWVDTDVPITSWHFGAEEPNVYNVPAVLSSDPWRLFAPHTLHEGDIINFTIPETVPGTYEAIRIYDPNTNKEYCVRQVDGTAVTIWLIGTKVSVRISNDLWPINKWIKDGTAYLMAWDSYYHEEGTLWFPTGTSSTVAFNALKKNGIQVYPCSAKQHISGAWVNKTAKSWQGGKWADWWNGELYDAGNEYTFVTGGWKAVNAAGATATLNSNGISFAYSGNSDRMAAIYTKNKVAINGRTLYVNVDVSINNQSFIVGLSTQNTKYVVDGAVVQKQTSGTGNMTLEVPLSGVSQGEYYVFAIAYAAQAVVKKVWLG